MKQKISKKTIKRLLTYFKKYKYKLFFVFICIIISTIASVLSSMILQTLIDDYITPLLEINNPAFTGLLKVILIIGVVYLFGVVTTYLYNRIMANISQSILKDIRDTMFKHMQYLNIKYFDSNSLGDIMSRYTNDTDTLRQMISQTIPRLISCVISIIATFIAMIYMSIPLTLFVIVFTLFILLSTKNIASKSGQYFVEQQGSIGKVNGYIEEMINGSKVVKVFTHEESVKKEFDLINDKLNDNMYKANKYANIMMPFVNSLSNLEYVLVAILGSAIAIKFDNVITVGALASFLSLTKSFNQPISQVFSQFNSVIMALAGSTRIFNLMDEIPEEDNGKVTLVNVNIDKFGNIKETNKKTNIWAFKIPEYNGYRYVQLEGKIELKNVTFAYDKKNVLHNVTLYAKPGQKIAFVGATGAGKTTITNLLNRFYDIKKGEILYDGINIKEIKKKDLRASLGMVLQDTNLFTGTIKDNIKYVKENATDKEVIEACKIANADEFIRMLPNGYDTIIENNGDALSQGQRQLLSIARVNLINPPVMILDEATASIDTRTEKIVQDGMDKLMEGRTVFVIAHRLSTVKNSKAIIVMDHGKIIERGNHIDLIKLKGEYYKLYTGVSHLE